MKRILFSFLGLMMMSTSVLEKSYGQSIPEYAPGSLIIKFTKEAVNNPNFQLQISQGTVSTGISSIDSLNMLFRAKSFKSVYFELYNPVEDKKLGKDRQYVLQFPAATDIKKLASLFIKNEFIEEAYPNYLFFTSRIPGNPLYQYQWALPKISAPSAWDIQTGNSGIVISILDT